MRRFAALTLVLVSGASCAGAGAKQAAPTTTTTTTVAPTTTTTTTTTTNYAALLAGIPRVIDFGRVKAAYLEDVPVMPGVISAADRTATLKALDDFSQSTVNGFLPQCVALTVPDGHTTEVDNAWALWSSEYQTKRSALGRLSPTGGRYFEKALSDAFLLACGPDHAAAMRELWLKLS